MRYNGISVLENMHLSEAMQLLLSESRINFLSHLSSDLFVDFYGLVVQLVLATDMSKHIEITSQFSALVNAGELSPGNKMHRLLLMKMFLKFADISNPSRTWSSCRMWADCVMREFFGQGDRERILGLPISPMMNRESTNVSKCQAAFIEFAVIPTSEIIAKVIPSLGQTLVRNAQ